MTTLNPLEDGATFGVQRQKINANDEALNDGKAEKTNVLERDNTNPWAPAGDYNPTTKIYVDGKVGAIINTYDPQGINADSFDRANHTGQQLPASIATDDAQKFVSELQIQEWTAKEDSIGPRNTAFNKNFGVVSGSVSEGNHLHSKASIGLGSVDDTSDADKPISIATQAELDPKALIDDNPSVGFLPQLSSPPNKEGRIFYDSVRSCLSVQSEVAEVTLQTGQQNIIRVINDSGNTLVAGQAVRYSGIATGTGVPGVALAQANTVANSVVVGIAAHSINNGALGYIVSFGRVENFNTMAFPDGAVMYLSATTPGAITNVPGNLAVHIGVIADSQLNGILFVTIPHISQVITPFGIIKDVPDTYTVTTAWQDIINYQVSDGSLVTQDTVNGTLYINNAGWYRGTLAIEADLTRIGNQGEEIELAVFNITAGAIVFQRKVDIGTRNDFATGMTAQLFNADSGDYLKIQMRSTDYNDDITFPSFSFDLVGVNVPY